MAQEIVQEAFVRAWEYKATPREPQSFQRWLFKCILNRVRDDSRRRSRWARLRFLFPDAPNAEIEIDRRMGNLDVARALVKLTPREREAVHLRFFEDWSFEEVARTLDIRESTARVLVHRALQKMRALISTEGPLDAKVDA